MHLDFHIVFRQSKTDLFLEHFAFLILDDIEVDHICRYPTSEKEKQDPLGTKLVVKDKYKGSIVWDD